MNELTLLKEEQIIGKNQLEIFKKYGVKCSATDFAILLGADVANINNYTNEGKNIKNRSVPWHVYQTDKYYPIHIIYINNQGVGAITNNYVTSIGTRPALLFSSIKKDLIIKENIINGIKEIEYGEYPQTAVDEDLAQELENAYTLGFLNKTGKHYTTYSYFKNAKKFEIIKNIEYEYSGKRYVRVMSESRFGKLSNRVQLRLGKYFWVQVEPLVWMVDEFSDIAITKRVVFSGVPIDDKEIREIDFNETIIKKYMDQYFSKEKECINDFNQEDNYNKVKKDPYNFNFSEVSEEEIIRGAIESNIAVFLHGQSSDGKSARVKQLDPDCEIIYLGSTNPESLIGKSVYNASTGEIIDVAPSWFKKISRKCEEEPDKIHILFFDELTNAMPSIQKYAFNIVLDKEVNGIWKLPNNCRIVAAGNETEDSLVANELAQPLFNRFAHVYIKTTVTSWLRWATTSDSEYKRVEYKEIEEKAKIHPSIFSYIAYKSYRKANVLRTKYNGQTPNADPRKWEMASKMLYATKKPEMLRSLIGIELTKDFIAFCNKRVITIEDVVKGNYSKSDLKMDLAEKFVTAVGLAQVDEKDFMVVRKFVSKLGGEVCATFDSLWSQGNKERLEKLVELQVEDIVEENLTYGY